REFLEPPEVAHDVEDFSRQRRDRDLTFDDGFARQHIGPAHENDEQRQQHIGGAQEKLFHGHTVSCWCGGFDIRFSILADVFIAQPMFKAHLFRIRSYEPRDLDAAAQAANAACRQAYAYFGYNHSVAVTRTRLMEAMDEGQKSFVPEVDGVV